MLLREELAFDRPARLQAVAPPEARGRARDDVRLLVTTAEGRHVHSRFADLPDWLETGDLLVVNNSATLAASLPARNAAGPMLLNLCTNYGGGLWLVEPRTDHATPGTLRLRQGERVVVGDTMVRLVSPFPGQERLWFARFPQDAGTLALELGLPIRYGYVEQAWPLSAYQTIFARLPGSAEMPSAGRPFSHRTLARLHVRGVEFAEITLHTGVSSLEVESASVEQHTLYPEPYLVPRETAERINLTRAQGRRVIAVGTTVVKALETAWDGKRVTASRGFSRRLVHPGRPIRTVDGLISGLHDPYASHLALLYALVPPHTIRAAYAEAVAHGYLWHEFGDSHLILRDERMAIGERPIARSD